MLAKHMDDAKREALAALKELLASETDVTKLVLIDDLFGRLRVVLWVPATNLDIKEKVDNAISQAAGQIWTNEIWMAEGSNTADKIVYDRAWEESRIVFSAEPRLHILERRRNRSAWFQKMVAPPWPTEGDEAGPPIITFYSFKGGVGRTTALAAFAIQRSRLGDRVAVIDMDLDAPGAGTLLAADDRGTTAPWGAIDYLLERPVDELDLRDYYHACRRDSVTGPGDIVVIPAGNLAPEREYLNKLARVDFEPPLGDDAKHPLHMLLEQVKRDLSPQWILLDARAGLSEPAGLLLGGVAHLHVIFGTSSEQSWQGVRVIIERLGASRVRENTPQLGCLLIQAMVPEDTTVGARAKEAFSARALEEFRTLYYAADPEGDDMDEDQLLYVRDSESSDAPHVPVAITYQQRLAHYDRIDDIANILADSPEYKEMTERIQQRFVMAGE